VRIVAGDKHFRELNEEINTCPDAEIELDNVCGQRYICSGLSGKKVTIHGIPGMRCAAIWTAATSKSSAMRRTPPAIP
jgi:hypothetical protein